MTTSNKSKLIVKQAADASIRFAGKLHPKLEDSTENSFYSPFSLLSALGMCLAGAKKETQKILAKLLEAPENEEDQKSFFKTLVDEVRDTENKPYELVTANALWPQSGLEFNDEFSKTITYDFGGKFV